ncbi:hypothetical protein AD951_10005 [Acetobacter malorum]|uniref:Uncharacterized protein n=1 Tax=Acetobacter malorum TaxID=178901 RepID=A0A149UL19_9PROT|nr:hypothetical protein AD951_10005 [Acetobacter malorum]
MVFFLLLSALACLLGWPVHSLRLFLERPVSTNSSASSLTTCPAPGTQAAHPEKLLFFGNFERRRDTR